MDLLEELIGAVEALDEAGVPYGLVGGWALAVHGVPRATTDIDLMVLAGHVDDALTALATRGFRHPAAPTRFPDGMDIQRVSKIEGRDLLTIDLLLVGESLQHAWASRASHQALGTRLWVVGRDALIAMKLWAGRPQDLADVARLQGDDR